MTAINSLDTKVKWKLAFVMGAASLTFLMQTPVWGVEGTESESLSAADEELLMKSKIDAGEDVGAGKGLDEAIKRYDEDTYRGSRTVQQQLGKAIKSTRDQERKKRLQKSDLRANENQNRDQQ